MYEFFSPIPPLVVISRCLLCRQRNTRLIYQRPLETIPLLRKGKGSCSKEVVAGWKRSFPSIESFEGGRKKGRKAGNETSRPRKLDSTRLDSARAKVWGNRRMIIRYEYKTRRAERGRGRGRGPILVYGSRIIARPVPIANKSPIKVPLFGDGYSPSFVAFGGVHCRTLSPLLFRRRQ